MVWSKDCAQKRLVHEVVGAKLWGTKTEILARVALRASVIVVDTVMLTTAAQLHEGSGRVSWRS